MKSKHFFKLLGLAALLISIGGCKIPPAVIRSEQLILPTQYGDSRDTSNCAQLPWRTFFSDDYLASLIDTALQNNQELNILLQEIEVGKNEVLARKGEYLPFVHFGSGMGMEKEGRYTRHGAVDEQLEIQPGREFPEPLTDFAIGTFASWEIDAWKKLRNARKSAFYRYLASVEGKNFMVTNLVAEIASSYYELMALDNLLNIVEQNIDIQSNALNIVRQQKTAGKVTQLAVNRFEAQFLNTQNLRYEIRQKVVETENRINALTGRFPQPVSRNSGQFEQLSTDSIPAGIPAQLLLNRPDIRQAELELNAAKLDIEVARANFYPSIGIQAGLGIQAFKPTLLLHPESILFNLAGDLVAPLVNKNAIIATYNTTNAQQIQAAFHYEQTVLNACVDVLNQLNNMENFAQSYEIKGKEVEILMQSVGIANSLFNSARADYAEVLLTQREALDSKMELIEIKIKQLNAKVNIYRALGGGWN